MAVWDGKQLKYGPLFGVDHPNYPMVVKTSEVFKNNGGKFVTADASTGTVKLSTASDTTLIGWLDCEGNDNLPTTATLSYTAAAGDVRNVILGNAGVVFRIPVKAALAANVVQAIVGDFCDLEVNTNLQTAAVGTTTRSTLIIVGGDFKNGAWVDVICNPAKLGSN